MMKQFFLLLVILLFSVPAFSNEPTVGLLLGSGGLGDESFNDMVFIGLGKVRKERNIRLLYKTWRVDGNMREDAVEMVKEGASCIVFNGGQYSSIITEIAHMYPDVYFIANDFEATAASNVRSIVYNHHEGAFLAGALAALFSKTGKIGFLGGVDRPIIKDFEVGFIEGAKHMSDTVTISARYIGVGNDFESFNRPQKGFSISMEMYSEGIDVIFHAAGLSGNGLIQAARKKGRYVIGVDANQDHMAPGYILTSVMKRMDTAVYNEVIQLLDHGFTPGTVRYNLKNRGISLTPMKYSRDKIEDETIDTLQSIKRQIIDGTLHVTQFSKL